MAPDCMSVDLSVDLRGGVSAFGGGEADLFSAWPLWEDWEPERGLKVVCFKNMAAAFF